MLKIGYIFAKLKYKLQHNNLEVLSEYYRRGGVTIGKNCCICSNLDKCDKNHLFLGNGVTVSTDVLFVTHDHSIWHIRHKWGDLHGKIIIGDNCFIGERSTIMYGVELANNVIVAAGSVVTKSFMDENIIIGGNPARVIGSWENFKEKYGDNNFDGPKDFAYALRTDDPRIIKRRNYK